MTSNGQVFIHQLFEEEVKRKPEEIALRFDNKKVTYRELNRRANWISGKLIALGIRAGDIAAVDFQSPLEMAAGIIGVIKAGGAYLPIPFSGSYPKEYILDVLEYSQPGYFLTNSTNCREIPFKGKTLIFDHLENVEDDYPDPQVVHEKENPLTVIYEYNPTGKEEGVSLSHQHILNWLEFNIEKLNIDFSRTLFISSSRMELGFPIWFANLVTGGEVHFYQWKQNNNPDIPEMINLFQEMKFKSVVCPLFYLQTMSSKNDFHYKEVFPGDLSNIISLGEEVFDIKGFKAFLKERKVRWHNYFGFPEITIISTLVEDNEKAGEEAAFRHIGKLAPDTDAYILNRKKKMVSKGMSGELYVSGKGVMDRYYRNQQLNKAHFLETSIIPGKEIYKSGYTASWLPDWKISLSTRTDNRLNINGCRIVVEVVEAALFRHPAVNDCIVVPRKTNNGKLWLTAYLVLKKDEDETNENLEEFLKTILPGDIFPIGFVRLIHIPRTRDGLADRKYLEQLDRFDSLLVKSLEKKIRKLPQIEHAAVLVEEKTERPVPLHLKDYLPDLRPVSSNNSKEPFETMDQPGHESERSELAIIHGDELGWEDGEPRTLADVLKRAATQHGDNGIRFIQADGSAFFQSYSSLLEEAEQVLVGLRKLGLKPQDKVLFQFNRNEDYVSAFWGCVLGGVIPVPLTVPKTFQNRNNETDTLYGVWRMLNKPVVLTNIHLKPSILSLFNDFHVVTLEELKTHEPDKDWHKGDPEDICLLLFTSGSTGKPKGVIHCHRNILARAKGAIRVNHLTPQDITINWFPLEHVVGLFMFHIKQVYLGCQQVHARIDYILADPLRWLDLITEYKVTLTWAPNFAYALVNEGLKNTSSRNWDLSSLRLIINGGEAINAETCKKFLTLLGPYKLSPTSMLPAWGMSETSSGIVYSYLFTPHPGQGVHHIDKRSLIGTIKKNNSPDHQVTFTELGRPFPGVSLRIADPGNQTVREGIVGRLQVKGVTVTKGYYENPELNKEVFTGDGWFDTGDMAFIRDGRMTITGRAKDVIIINGINLNSTEMEAAIEEVEGVETSYTAACGARDNDSNTDRVVIYYNSKFSDFNRQLEQIKEIKRKFIERFGIPLDYAIPVQKQDIPKTSIGKIQRTKLGNLFEAGHFDDIVRKIDIGLENENTVPSWFFKKTWHRQEIGFMPWTKCSGNACLIFEDESGVGRTLSGKLEKNNQRCIKIKAGTQFKKNSRDCYEINPSMPGDYSRLLEAISWDNIEISDIFHLFGYGEVTGPTVVDTNSVRRAQSRGVYSLLSLIQTLAKTNGSSSGPINLFVITSGTQFISENDTLVYEKFGITGFLKCVSLELSWLHCHYIDLEIDAVENNIQWILKEMRNPKRDVEVAYRNGNRWVPFLQPIEIEGAADREFPLKQGGIYLVTGGLGGIGVHLCKWLLENFRAKLIVVGRTPLPVREQWDTLLQQKSLVSNRLRAYRDIAFISNEFIYEAGDISDESFLNDLVSRAESKWNDTLSGIFHLAGVGNLEDHWKTWDKHLVTAETYHDFDSMYYSKVYGTLTLHRLLERNPGAVFVAFSSTTSFFGAAAFSAYSAANSYLDSFCLYRRHAGFPNTFCLSWSSWDNVGMSENNPDPMAKAMRANGYEMILPQQGISSMLIALRLNSQQIFIGLNPTNSHIRSFMAEYPSVNQVVNVYYTIKNMIEIDEPGLRHSILPMIASLDKNNRAVLKMHRIDEMPLIDGKFIDYKQLEDMVSHLRDMTFEDELPQTETEQKMVKIWREVLGKSQIGINDNFFELGGHSLKATALESKIHKAFDVIMPLDEIFRNPTIKGMVRYLETKTAAKDRYISIEPVEKKSDYPLSSAQKRLYILHRMEPQSTAYNLFQSVSLPGEVDMERLEKAFIKLLERHESLRTSFHIIANESVQRIHEKVEFAIEYYDSATEDTGNTEEKGQTTVGRSDAHLSSGFTRPFDLAQAPLMRVGVVKIDASPRVLLIEMHHIITDGTSQHILEKEFMTLFSSPEVELTPLRLQYKDYSEWQNSEEQNKLLKQQELYWVKAFSDELPVLHLPADYPRPLMQSFEGSMVTFVLTGKETQRLKDIAKETDTTLYMTILAVFTVLLSKLSGQEDIIVGTPVAVRRHMDLERIIGMFVNTLAIRNHPSGEKSFKAFLKEIKKQTLEAIENQEYPFEDLVDQVAVLRDTSRNPIFDVMFNLLNMKDYTGDLPGIDDQDFHSYQHTTRTSIFDLNLTAVDAVKQLVFNLQYCTRLFKTSTIDRITRYFNTIISSLSGDIDVTLADIEIMSGEEKRQLLVEFNDTEAQFPGNKTIHRLFEEQAARALNNIAVVGQSSVHPGIRSLTHLSFGELNEKAHELAILLRSKGVNTDKIVGVITRRSIEMIIGIMAILEAGGAYLPLDPDYPETRITYIMAESKAEILLNHLPEVVEFFRGGGSTPPIKTLASPLEPGDSTSLAYVIYTSGSTGTPKGVAVQHRSVVNIINALFKKYPLVEKDAYLLKTPCVFDVSVSELFGWFPGGGRLAILEPGAEKDPQKIIDITAQLLISHINFVPSMFRVFVHWLSTQPLLFRQLSSLKYIFLAGEALSALEVNKFRELDISGRIRLENIYGPTEAAVYAAQYSLSEWDGSTNIPIGKPLQNVNLYILDQWKHVSPVGVRGELCIAGIGLARGYLNNPGLTARGFCPWRTRGTDKNRMQSYNHATMRISPYHSPYHPITPIPPYTLYMTGDLARWLPDGNIEFLGRIDHQVKVRGFRIELGEIEQQLLRYDEIKETLVTIISQEDGNRYLCAYIVRAGAVPVGLNPGKKPFITEELRVYLSKSLPDYMIPSYFVEIEKIPLTPSGKVDRKALPAPEVILGLEYVAPGDEVEEKLAAIWSEILGLKKDVISIDANFFGLGGMSLKAIILASMIQKEFNVKLPLAEIFKSPTIKRIASLIKVFKWAGTRKTSINQKMEEIEI